MISMQLLGGVLLAVAALVGIAIALSVVILASASASKPGQAPHGGIRRNVPDLPQRPQPDTDRARELVLV
jgi:hypothetical protein